MPFRAGGLAIQGRISMEKFALKISQRAPIAALPAPHLISQIRESAKASASAVVQCADCGLTEVPWAVQVRFWQDYPRDKWSR